MSQEILALATQIIPSFAQPVIAIYDQTGKQVLANASVIKASVKPDSKLMDHPIESVDGTTLTNNTITDDRIFEPREIELAVIMTGYFYKQTYQQMIQLYESSTLLNVQTDAGLFNNYVIKSPPHEESADHFQAFVVALTLRQIQTAMTQTEPAPVPAPANAQNQATTKRGDVQPQDATQPQKDDASILYNLF